MTPCSVSQQIESLTGYVRGFHDQGLPPSPGQMLGIARMLACIGQRVSLMERAAQMPVIALPPEVTSLAEVRRMREAGL